MDSDDPVGYGIVDVVHQPLGNCRQPHRAQDFPQYPGQTGEIHISLSHNAVHCPACKYGDVKCKGHRDQRQDKGHDDAPPVLSYIIQDTFQGLHALVFI